MRRCHVAVVGGNYKEIEVVARRVRMDFTQQSIASLIYGLSDGAYGEGFKAAKLEIEFFWLHWDKSHLRLLNLPPRLVFSPSAIVLGSAW